MRAVALVLAISAAGCATARAQTITFTPPTEVARAPAAQRFVEPHLAIHPAHPGHLLATSYIVTIPPKSDEVFDERRCATFLSTDDGKSWSRHDFPVTQCYDEQVAIAPDGNAVFVALAHLPSLAPDRSDWLIVFHSRDGGATWDEKPATLGWRYDHPAVTFDRSSSPRRNWFYITAHLEWSDGTPQRKSAVMVTRSRNGGGSFDHPTFLTPSAMHNIAEMPVVLSDGTLVVAYVDDNWSTPLQHRHAWIARSTDGGVTFSAPVLVSEECGPPPGFQLSSLAGDDRLYFACRQGGGGPIVVSASADRGATWSNRGVVAGVKSVNPDWRRVVSIAVNGTGTLGILSVERRPEGGDSCLVTLFSASTDQGKTFAPPVVLSHSPCGESDADRIVARRFPTYGDYYGLVATPGGEFRAVWPQMRDGASALVTTTISVVGR